MSEASLEKREPFSHLAFPALVRLHHSEIAQLPGMLVKRQYGMPSIRYASSSRDLLPR